MKVKSKLILAGISAVIIIISLAYLAVKWPVPSGLKHDNNTISKSKEPILPPPAPSPSVNVIPTKNQTKLKMIPFPQEGIPVLMYHSIGTIPGNSLGVPVKQFTEEMEWLRCQGYHSISTEDLYQALTHKALVPEKPILLTFDDGYADNYKVAWPILRQNEFRATFFVTTNSIGPGMMNWDQLNELTRQGNSIGSHTVHHLDLARLSYTDQKSEIANSKEKLENSLGIRETALCFPSGRYNKTTLELMPKLGYRLGFTTKSGRVHLGDDLLILKRERIYGGMPKASFERLFP